MLTAAETATKHDTNNNKKDKISKKKKKKRIPYILCLLGLEDKKKRRFKYMITGVKADV
jgi:hypothetical protein